MGIIVGGAQKYSSTTFMNKEIHKTVEQTRKLDEELGKGQWIQTMVGPFVVDGQSSIRIHGKKSQRPAVKNSVASEVRGSRFQAGKKREGVNRWRR